jgi:hypothetical protein
MSKPSKLKEMAAAGNLWAIETLKRLQAQGRAAGRRGAAMQRKRRAQGQLAIEPPTQRPPRDPAFTQAMEDARDILQWRQPRPPTWRIYRLAMALMKQEDVNQLGERMARDRDLD